MGESVQVAVLWDIRGMAVLGAGRMEATRHHGQRRRAKVGGKTDKARDPGVEEEGWLVRAWRRLPDGVVWARPMGTVNLLIRS